MGKISKQTEKDISASFGYVKKDMLMLNDAFSDIHEKVQELSLNYAVLLEEVEKLKKQLVSSAGKKVAKRVLGKKKVAGKILKKKKVVKKVAKVETYS
jgi:hypothetical protein